MQQLKFPPFERKSRDINITVSNGQTFVFTMRTSTYLIIKDISLTLTIGGTRVPYKIILDNSAFEVICFGASARRFYPPKGDSYIVVKVDKTATSPAYFTTYINGDFIATTEALNRESGPSNGAVLDVDSNGDNLYKPSEAGYKVAGVLTVFDESEKEKAAAFTEAMRNPEAGYFLHANQAVEDKVRLAESVKHYKFERYFGQTTEIPISDGHTFVFTFSTSAYLNIVDFSVSLNFGNTASHTVRLYLGKDAITISPGRRVLSMIRLSEEDANVVVRIVRTNASPPTFTTYVNGDLAATTEALNGTGGLVDHASLTKTKCHHYTVIDRFHLTPVLTVFDESGSGKAAAFAEAMRNPEAGFYDPASSDLEDKALEDREKTLQEKETAVEARERAVTEREKKLMGGDGGDNLNQSSSGANVQPPDMEMMKDSTAMGWPKAVRLVLVSESGKVKQRLDILMSDWVVARGDNISPDAYDYFVYSHGVAWPKAVLETTTYAKLAEVRERHAKIMEALGY